jgi:hypothetical protein
MITALFRKAQHNLTLHLSKIQESTTIAHGVNYKKDAYKPATPLPILPLINYEKATYNPPPNTKTTELSTIERHGMERKILESSLNRLQLSDSQTKQLTTVPHAKLDAALTTNITTKLIHEILHDNSSIFPQDLPIKEALGKKKIGLMWPRGIANLHPAAPMLHHYSTHGCPVDCGDNWTTPQIIAAIKRGPHISAHHPIARKCLIDEAIEKQKGGYAKIIKFKDIKNNLPPSLKISPVAMIPHKSRLYRCILDLSFDIIYKNIKTTNVNATTTKLAPQKSMAELGTVLHRFVHTLATYAHLQHPFAFCKVDIKDGFWRMVVSETNAWNFCYTLPPLSKDCELDDIEIVVPHSLQMGWTDSPPFFGSATETARDVIEWLISSPTELPPHPLEVHICNHKLGTSLGAELGKNSENNKRIKLGSSVGTEHGDIDLIEVYVDDFIIATNNLNHEHLQHLARSVLHGVHSLFPPPAISKHSGEDPVSIKKLSGGEGVFAYNKEILGWIFDGNNYTIYLPPSKTSKIIKTIKSTIKKQHLSLKKFQQLIGKLMHASIGLPMGKSLLSPAFAAMRNDPASIIITQFLKQCLQDWITLLQRISLRPTHVRELVMSSPSFMGYVDACAFGAGGVWFSGQSNLEPTVWRVQFPAYIVANLISEKNPTGQLTNSDLEMAGLLCQWLVLECIAPHSLQYNTIGIFSDNTPTVAWANKLTSSSSTVASYLVRALAIRLHVKQANTVTTHEAGATNQMADVSSRSTRLAAYTQSSAPFLTIFSSQFPLPQGQCWKEFHLPPKWLSRVMSCLRGKPLPMAQWTTLPNDVKNTGETGVITVNAGATHLSSPPTPHSNVASSSLPSLLGSGLATTATERTSKLVASQTRSVPSPRPVNWLDNQARSTKHTKLTSCQWHGLWKE